MNTMSHGFQGAPNDMKVTVHETLVAGYGLRVRSMGNPKRETRNPKHSYEYPRNW